MPNARCPVCSLAPMRRQAIEDAYLSGASVQGEAFHRTTIERHMSHLADPESLRQVTGLTSATALAARLRALEATAEAILDLALDQRDGKLALQALREVRGVIETMSKLTATLESQHQETDEKPELDQAIRSFLLGQGVSFQGDAQGEQPDPESDHAEPDPNGAEIGHHALMRGELLELEAASTQREGGARGDAGRPDPQSEPVGAADIPDTTGPPPPRELGPYVPPRPRAKGGVRRRERRPDQG